MSFDLYFCRETGSNPAISELKDYFAALSSFDATDTGDGGVQFVYQNESTGVYCDFSFSPLDANELDDCGSSGLTFNLNYNRPSFFAYETMPLVEAFCKHFDLVTEDPQEETVGPADAQTLITSWRNHNTNAVRALAEQADVKMYYLPESSATAWWRYMMVQHGLDEAMTEDIFVPTPFILTNAEDRTFTMTLWPDGIAQFFPPADYVLVKREKKRFFSTTEETGFITDQALMANIGQVLDDYEFRGLPFKYLRPENKDKAAPLLRKLNLEPFDVKQCARLHPGGFHDVDGVTNK